MKKNVYQSISRAYDKNSEQALLYSSEFDKEHPGKLFTLVPKLILLTLLVLLLWASIAPVIEVTRANGKLVPSDSIVQIQHQSSAEVIEVKVGEGDLVEQGDVLFKLDPVLVASELSQLRARHAFLSIESERLHAIMERREPDFSAFEENYPVVVKHNSVVFNSQKTVALSKINGLKSKVKQKQHEQEYLKEQLKVEQNQLASIDEKVAMIKELKDSGSQSRLSLIQASQERDDMLSKISNVVGRIAAVGQQVMEAEHEIAETYAAVDEKATMRLATIESERHELSQTLARTEHSFKNLVVRSPIKGFVTGLTIDAVGEVVTPGATLVEIIPYDSVVLAEAKVDTQDISALKLGQDVNVKVTAFDFSQHGMVTGKLQRVSKNSFQDEDGQPYFKANILLDEQWVGAEGNRLLPGMVVQADILSGEKSVIQYLLKPLRLASQRAFTEK
ncbi:HlyD family secretion protein/adhesin transport system membrane fusion protein [Sinobacterium caligoides]|uniref:Membrane fusion protein (MFP) family protein n=1 Tax=Sinobacterium caligoides TaxID=933926 RepID=A0A3N2DRV3_9GAMM|nr:HlyD family type I secretion periplasmic adaptor subunit [Sinobacterium caligoides]ROS02035.1 HlyD family secretion protein/adhesin transport system membrane fusion protein [Sinobacterium caligoides]